jgi:rod shape-determining protein MreC
VSWFQRNRLQVSVIGILAFSFLIFVAHMKDVRSQSWLDRSLLWITAPIQHAVVWTIEGVADLWTNYVYLVGVREENQRLVTRQEELERKLSRMAELEAENNRLTELLGKKLELPDADVVPARVVAVGTSTVVRSIRIDVGGSDRVKVGDPVIAGAGLVGRISGTTAGYAEVQLIVDGRSAVGVLIQRSRERAILRGRGEDKVCSLDYLVRTADVQQGDQVVTSGIGGTYPSGLLVGTVTRVTAPRVGVFREADLEPSVAFQSLEEVLVIRIPQKGEAGDQPPAP